MKFLFSFAGRIGRGKFWLGLLAQYILLMVTMSLYVVNWVVTDVAHEDEIGPFTTRTLGDIVVIVSSTVLVASILVSVWWWFAISVQRMHDRGRSGWWVLPMFLLAFVVNRRRRLTLDRRAKLTP